MFGFRMADIPDIVVWIVVGAIVVEGFALMVLTYLMWKASEKQKEVLETEKVQDTGHPDDEVIDDTE